MSLPSSGYSATGVDYTVAVDGSPAFTFNISVDATILGESLAEEVIAVLEPALITLAADLESVSGATSGHVFKSTRGTINSGDIA